MSKMDAPRADDRDIFRFAERKEKEFVYLVKKEMQSLSMIKVEFALSVQMPKKIGQCAYIHISKINQKSKRNGNQKKKITEFINEVNTKIEAWIESGSDIRFEKEKRLM